MSLEVVLKNVYSFLDVLQSALSDKVQAWENETIDNAIRWAQYCEQLYKQASGKSYQAELDQQIQLIGELPWALGSIKVDLSLMADCQSLLKKALLQNPCLGSGLFQYVVSLYGIDSDDGQRSLIETCYELYISKASADILLALRNSLECEKHETTEEAVQIQARFLVQFINSSLQKSPEHKKQRTLSFLKKKLNEYSKKAGSLGVLSSALTGKYPDILTDTDMENTTKTLILHVILDMPDHRKQEIKHLLKPLQSTSQATT